MPVPRIAVFTYNFPHKKTQDFLFRLLLENFNVTAIIAADPIRLNIPVSTIRTKLRPTALVHPKKIAERFKIPYYITSHNDIEISKIVKKHEIDLAIISGARILKEATINLFPMGVINFHPGLVPEARGLDAMLWSIYGDIPLGVTAHLIDKKIDAGKILVKQQIALHLDDTLFDLSERLNDTQLEMIAPAIQMALSGNGESVDPSTNYNRKMPPEIEVTIDGRLPSYLQRMLQSK